jgi:DNA polymerase-1
VGDRADALAASRAIVERNRRLMRMRADLPVPSPETARVPLDRLAMRRAFADRGIILGPSLWALTGGAPPPGPAELALVPRAWVWTRRSRRDRAPGPGQLALF